MATILTVGGGVLALGVLLYVVPYVGRRFSVRKLAKRCRDRRALAITFDDGPGPRLTPRILAMLDEWSATGTFFPLGARAERFPEVIGAVAEAGHEIGCHGQNHRNALRVGPLRAFRDAARGFETLSPWLSCPRLFRPPFGKLDSIAWLLLRWKGVKLGWWTIDSGDTRGSQKDRTLVEEVRRCRGGVVLLHDFDRISGRDDHVLALLKELLMLARREGIRLVRLSELLD